MTVNLIFFLEYVIRLYSMSNPLIGEVIGTQMTNCSPQEQKDIGQKEWYVSIQRTTVSSPFTASDPLDICSSWNVIHNPVSLDGDLDGLMIKLFNLEQEPQRDRR